MQSGGRRDCFPSLKRAVLIVSIVAPFKIEKEAVLIQALEWMFGPKMDMTPKSLGQRSLPQSGGDSAVTRHHVFCNIPLLAVVPPHFGG
jgi:hypothetical protein